MSKGEYNEQGLNNMLHKKSQLSRNVNCDNGLRPANCSTVHPYMLQNNQIHEFTQSTQSKIEKKEYLQTLHSNNNFNVNYADESDSSFHGDINKDFSLSKKEMQVSEKMASRSLITGRERTNAIIKTNRGTDRRPLHSMSQYSETVEARKQAEEEILKKDFGSALYANDKDVTHKGFKIGKKVLPKDNF